MLHELGGAPRPDSLGRQAATPRAEHRADLLQDGQRLRPLRLRLFQPPRQRRALPLGALHALRQPPQLAVLVQQVGLRVVG